MNGVLVDSSVILDIFEEDIHWVEWSESVLDRYSATHILYINPIIYSEISVGFERIEEVEEAVAGCGFKMLQIPKEALFLAGKTFIEYRRRKGIKISTLPDFFIGAHAAVDKLELMTRDTSRIRSYFPTVKLIKYLESHHFSLMLGAIAISFSPLAVKVVTFSPTVSAFYRAFYAAIFFLIFALWRQKTAKAFSPRFWSKNKLWILPSIAAGIFLGVDLILWHKTIVYLGAGPATFLGNSQVIFVTIFAALIFRERITGVFYVFVAVILSGLYMLLPSKPVGISLSIGYIMGLFVGLMYAGMLVALRYAKMNAKEDYPELWSLFYVFVVSAHEGSMMLMIQPILATIWGMFLFHETLGIIQIVGIIISLAGIVMYQVKLASRRWTLCEGF